MPVATTKRFTRTDDSSAPRGVVGAAEVTTDANARDALDGAVFAEVAGVGAAGIGLTSIGATLDRVEMAGAAAVVCARDSDTGGALHAEVPSRTIKQAMLGERTRRER